MFRNFDKGLMVAASLICVLMPLSEAADLKNFESRRNSFSVQYPGNWYLQSLSDHFYIESFPPSEAVRAVRLPAKGASITISVPSELVRNGRHETPRNMEEWVTLGTARRSVIGKRALELDDGERKLPLIEVKTQCCAVPPFQESIDWYFEIAGHMFVANLEYWQGDANADNLREILKNVVLSVRANVPGVSRP
jgi:hypothetical protein